MEYHDLGVSGIQLYSEKRRIEIDVEPYDEESDDYLHKKLLFQDIQSFEMDYFSFEEASCEEVEIYSLNVVEKEDLFIYEILLLLGFGRPSSTIKIITISPFVISE